MTGRHPFKKLIEDFSPEQQTRVAKRIARLKGDMALAELRQARQQSQQDIARTLNVKQPTVAKREKRTDMYVSNLRRYIEALGGSLEITATFPEGRVNITNFSDLASALPTTNTIKNAKVKVNVTFLCLFSLAALRPARPSSCRDASASRAG